MDRFRVAATQLQVRHQDTEGNLQTHCRLIAETAAAGCDLVLFPELSVTGHNGSPEVLRSAEPLDGGILHAISNQARDCGIVVSYGFCETFRGTQYNSSVIVGPDGLIGVQRKVHASFDEFFRFRQAYEWNVFDLGFCTVGTAICHDSDFFEFLADPRAQGRRTDPAAAREPEDVRCGREAHVRRLGSRSLGAGADGSPARTARRQPQPSSPSRRHGP